MPSLLTAKIDTICDLALSFKLSINLVSPKYSINVIFLVILIKSAGQTGIDEELTVGVTEEVTVTVGVIVVVTVFVGVLVFVGVTLFVGVTV